MRSTAALKLSTLLFLFPVLISGFPFLRRDGNNNGTSNSTSSTESAPSGSSNNTSDPSSNSTSSPASDLATSLMTLNLLIAGAFYQQSAVISQGLKDFNTSAILTTGALLNAAQLTSLNPTAKDLNCTFDLGSVLDDSNTANLIDSMVYIESIKRMGAANLLSNTSLELSQTEQDLFNGIYQDAHQVSVLAGNITVPGLPLGNSPNLTQEDYNSLLFRFNPTCLNDLGLQNLSSRPQIGFGAPHILSAGFVVTSHTTGCADLSEVFCQVITAGLNGTQAVVSPQSGECNMRATTGLALFYTTRTSDPLSIDPTERQAQEGNICSGSELFLLDVNN